MNKIGETIEHIKSLYPSKLLDLYMDTLDVQTREEYQEYIRLKERFSHLSEEDREILCEICFMDYLHSVFGVPEEKANVIRDKLMTDKHKKLKIDNNRYKELSKKY